MIRDLLSGFAARGWSETLDFTSLNALPASYVSQNIEQRHSDPVWRIRFRDERWLYVVVLLKFQSTVDQRMAVRMLTYTGLLYERLIADGALRDHDKLPPVLPIVI
ncbi:MAG: Rpn family recombination-promoting nuclease/putative transposase [Acidobacteria bacterium]|nr:Rpn family recombination-promoting nuclease/putative transposase [Acidobacteriota bacterium]